MIERTLLGLVATLLAAAPALAQQTACLPLATPDGIRFGIWPDKPKQPSPTLFVFASTFEKTLDDPYFRQSGNELARRGYLCVSLDIPCHGDQLRAGEPAGLAGWRYRCEQDDDFTAGMCSRLRTVLDYLIAAGMTDRERIAACGTSRGGFVALHLAAAEPRVKCVAAFAPVTDLTVLNEFKGAEPVALTQRLSIEKQAAALAGRAVWLIIGDRDKRVGTDATISLARRITAASLSRQLPALVDLHVVAEPKGHTTPAGAAEQAAEWIDRQLNHK